MVLASLLSLVLSVIVSQTTPVAALGSACGVPLTTGNAAWGEPYWLENIQHRGIAPFAPNATKYQVFRNVKEYGAVGDGVHDDTAAINAAISTGTRCGNGTCGSSTTTPAVVYFPAGSYLVSSPLQAYYYTVMVGDARTPPTLLASANFTGIAVIDADPYGANQANWYTNQDSFFRSARNFVIDVTRMPANVTATGIHWQVSQSTSLVNVVVNMSTKPGNNHQGLYMEDGSGGFMGDIVFNGGKYGIWVGNQQFTVRNLTVNGADTAVFGSWNWGWTYQHVIINDCQIGFDLSNGGSGGEAIIDAVVTNTPVFLKTPNHTNVSVAGSIVLNNIHLNNVSVAVMESNATILAGGTKIIESWGKGNVYTGTHPNGTFTQGNIQAAYKDPSLLDHNGFIVSKGHPMYADYSVDQFKSVKSMGAVGDGVTDDTEAIKSVLAKYAGCYIIYFDAGIYKVTSTIQVPAGTRIVGEAWTQIMGAGSYFNNQEDPNVVVQVGTPGSQGVTEITDIVFTTQGPTAGAIVVEWNVRDPFGQQGAAGMWDSHIRLGGANGTHLQDGECPSGTYSTECFAAFLGLHITYGATAYLEGTWVWLADHDLDGFDQLTLFSGRGILSHSQGPVWMIGTSEHHVLYQFSLVGAKNHYMGLIQTETPYFQPDPAPPGPFSISSVYDDPTFENGMNMAWGLSVQSSIDIIVFGAGHYSFFQNFSTACLGTTACQTQMVNVDWTSSVSIYNLATVGTTYQLSIEGDGIIYFANNSEGFSSTVTLWSPARAIYP
ncbi:glycoside hydrolase family 55 protein [Suillus clintonianus]|uniref:glycoside hydrolase family 55 protein n=1 Tax=Suillus clintonianus TaxID=1904413 RepID=UPI001B87CAE0|nr:glycoside hydrolase family 55 protein [Suillus clintonianus]KAG2149369.1 glycoside hydrolase family 55 protein [Suillus clintonianus]